jgi:hypothetical protein
MAAQRSTGGGEREPRHLRARAAEQALERRGMLAVYRKQLASGSLQLARY